MKLDAAVIATDAVTRHMTCFSLAGLCEMIERNLLESLESGCPPGMPMNMSHDKHRLIGWTLPKGVYVAKDMARQVALMLQAETEEELSSLTETRKSFVQHLQRKSEEPYLAELFSLLATDAPVQWQVNCYGAVSIISKGLASGIFPEFFDPASEHVDGKGLVAFEYLLERTKQIEPGVFHEPVRDVVLFVHPYFRRSQSRDNSINAYVMQSFSEAANEANVRGKLRLDPDMIGHPRSVRPVMELEWWNGPKFDDDIEKIPSGVTEHKHSDRDRTFSLIDRAQMWWKDPEHRETTVIRTFEIEELVETPSAGLQGDAYGCRYAHAEYDVNDAILTHFDGAIRAYTEEAFLERIDRRIDRAGKHSDYSKLFRLDGSIPVPIWKRVMSDFYRGNSLVPEYLGAPSEVDIFPQTEEAQIERSLPALSFYYGSEIAARSAPDRIRISADKTFEVAGQCIRIAELTSGALGDLILPWMGDDVGRMTCNSTILNIGPILFPASPLDKELWQSTISDLVRAIKIGGAEPEIGNLSITLRWFTKGLAHSLSVAGAPDLVAEFLDGAAAIVRFDQSASEWIEDLQKSLTKIAPDLVANVDWPKSVVHLSRIDLDQEGECQVEFLIPA